MVGLLYFNNGQLISDYLRRHSVPGHPEVNQMFTTLDMNGQTLNNANQVNATDVTASQTVTAGGGNVHLRNQAGEGGVVRLTGANGQNVHLQNINGTFRTLNSPWTMETWSVDQAGNTSNAGQASSSSVKTQIMYDSNNTGYYVDPNGTNRINYVDADNQLTRGYHGADAFYDRYNNNYYAQLRGTNRLNYVDADNQLTRGINEANAFKVNYVAAVGASCAGYNGGIAQDGTGQLLNCISGVWKKLGEKSATQTGTWGGRCTTLSPPAGTSTTTHNISYIWVHRSQCNWEQSHTLHNAGVIASDAGVTACGSEYCPIGGSFMVVAVSK
ncbi:shufflon system plasmid conjugative transfer pilus tip adhesin PilV [Methylobacter sp. BBA5.1]|uniref:shufflon system plasmid conjugative transfer pilus tip adhesin PilV n=1 Tax=Methylobacter sp. BBA5.1 TaxID=1495064 RepID=UPI00210076FF|nr:shufflon system plasmid conjugative transfer pilus tip adhesin PilV [Methylobacter sp. BBA5.1]